MNIKKFLQIVLIIAFVLLVVSPSVSFAQFGASNQVFNSTLRATSVCPPSVDIGGIICRVGYFLKLLIPILVTLGVIYFVWGVVQYVIGGGEEAKTKGRDKMIFGIIGLTVIISVWGLVYIVVRTFGTGGVAPSDSELQNLLPQ